MKTYPPQPALRILHVSARVQIPRIIHQQDRVLFENEPRHVLSYALRSVKQVIQFFDCRVGVGVRRGGVMQDVLPEAYRGTPR